MRTLFSWLKRKNPGVRARGYAAPAQNDRQTQYGNHVAAAIHRFHQYHQARHEAEDRKARKDYWWVRVTTIFAVIAGIATAFAAVFTGLSMNAANRSAKQGYRQAEAAIKANQVNAESGRAWIAPTELHISGPFNLEIGVRVRLNYTNPGKEPATNVVIRSNLTVIRYDEGKKFSDLAFPEITEILCGPVSNNKDSSIAFPTVPPNGFAIDVSRVNGDIGYVISSAYFGRRLPFNYQPLQDVVEDKATLLAIFCFDYFTAQKSRLTMVCYYMQPSDQPITAREWHFCPTGQKAT